MPDAQRLSWLVRALVLTLALRILYSGLGAWLAPRLTLDGALIRSNAFTEALMSREEGWRYAVVGVWERFDTLWYVHIAEHGYDRPDAVVFFPLYPILIRLMSPLVGSLVASLLIATVATFFLLLGLGRLLALDRPPDEVMRALVLLGVWPASFVLFAGYADSLAIALVVWSIHEARRERWTLAGVLGFFAGLAKATGVLVIVPLAVIAWRARSRRAWPLALGALSLPAVVLVHWLSGAGTATRAYATFWRTELAFPWTTLVESLRDVTKGGFVVDGSIGHETLVALNLVLLVLIFVPVFAKRLRPEYTLYALAALLLFLSKKTDPLLQSSDRYVLAVFPAFAVWASWLRNRWVLAAAVFVLFLVNALLLLAFFEWALVV